MLVRIKERKQSRRGEDGTIVIMTAIAMLSMMLALGIAIDASRIFMIRTEMQNAADASALAASRELNSGRSGIRNAVTRANAIANTFGFQKTNVSLATVEFAVNVGGPFVNQASAEAAPGNIRFVRVTTTTNAVPILFALRALGASNNEVGIATAGMSVGINGICDFFPIAVALDPAVEPGDDPNTGYPLPDTEMTIKFVQGTGNEATLANKDYIILEVPDINGNGAPETAVLSAGVTSICQSLNANIDFHMTPSSNVNNGPQQIADGTNTRFNMYANGYGNALTPANFPPDSNVNTTTNYADYSASTNVVPPSPNAPGVDQRRVIVTPIIWPGTYNPPRALVKKWAAFFLKSPVTYTHPCSQGEKCAEMQVEWIDERLVLGRGFFDPNNPETSLTLPVLYR